MSSGTVLESRNGGRGRWYPATSIRAPIAFYPRPAAQGWIRHYWNMYSRTMGRAARFQREQIAAATLRLVADRGPQAVTIAAVAQEVGAPTGSIYHRYAGRSQLLAELWMDVVEAFQAQFVASLAAARDADGAAKAARSMAGWTREHPLKARLLLLHRRQDFCPGEWPPELVDRAKALEPQLGAALAAFARRAFGRSNADLMLRLRYALLDAPFGGVKPYVQADKPIPQSLDDLIECTARAILGSIPSAAG
jgi:AcrR family transcriptional regulator